MGKKPAHFSTPGQYVVRFLDNSGPVKLALSFARYTTALGAVRGPWCLEAHQVSPLMRGIVHNVDESRRAELAGYADLNTSPQPMLVFACVSSADTGAGVDTVSLFCGSINL